MGTGSTPEGNAAVLEEALLSSMDLYAQDLVDRYIDPKTGSLRDVHGADAALAATMLSALAIRRVESHSRNLVRLTWVLLGTTIALAGLTAVLLWRTVV